MNLFRHQWEERLELEAAGNIGAISVMDLKPQRPPSFREHIQERIAEINDAYNDTTSELGAEYFHAYAHAPALLGLLFERDENPPAQRGPEGVSQDLNELAGGFMGLFRSQEEPHNHQE